MRPNGRTLYKVLMKGRRNSFWGRRAFLTVRLPLSILPVPCPSKDYAKGWGEEVADGHWRTESEDGGVCIHNISEVSSTSNPKDLFSEEELEQIHYITSRNEYGYESFSWWEGEKSILDGSGQIVETEPLPIEAIDAHRAWVFWANSYLHGENDVERGPALEAFLQASHRAKTHYASFSEDGKYLYFTYSVKPFLRERTKRFCSDLKRAFEVAHAHGIDAKLSR